MYIQWSYHLTNLLIHVMPQMLSVGDLFKPSREIPFNPQHFSSLTRKYNHKFLFFIYLLHFPHPKPSPCTTQIQSFFFPRLVWGELNPLTYCFHYKDQNNWTIPLGKVQRHSLNLHWSDGLDTHYGSHQVSKGPSLLFYPINRHTKLKGLYQ